MASSQQRPEVELQSRLIIAPCPKRRPPVGADRGAHLEPGVGRRVEHWHRRKGLRLNVVLAPEAPCTQIRLDLRRHGLRLGVVGPYSRVLVPPMLSPVHPVIGVRLSPAVVDARHRSPFLRGSEQPAQHLPTTRLRLPRQPGKLAEVIAAETYRQHARLGVGGRSRHWRITYYITQKASRTAGACCVHFTSPFLAVRSASALTRSGLRRRASA